MSLNLQTVETTANLDENGVLHIAKPIQGLEAGEVLVIVVARPKSDETRSETPKRYDDISREEWNHAMMQSSALAFLKDSAEDIYTLEDGEPIDWKAK